MLHGREENYVALVRKSYAFPSSTDCSIGVHLPLKSSSELTNRWRVPPPYRHIHVSTDYDTSFFSTFTIEHVAILHIFTVKRFAEKNVATHFTLVRTYQRSEHTETRQIYGRVRCNTLYKGNSRVISGNNAIHSAQRQCSRVGRY